MSDDSETARLVQRVAWEKTALGPMAQWPQSLKTSISICLACRFPIIVWWGPEMVVLYNDDYIPMLGDKHPAAMGGAGREVWADVWPVVGPMLEEVVRTGKAAKADDLLLLMRRHGYLEETYFSFSYSPILDESGGVGGIFTPVVETTEKVVGQRRIDILRKLGSQPRAQELTGACAALAAVLAEAANDVPFGMLYAVDETGARAECIMRFGLDAHAALAPPALVPDEPDAFWPLQAAITSKEPQTVSGLARHSRVPAGTWGEPVDQAIVLPIAIPGHTGPLLLIAAVSPHRALDETYFAFYKLLADQVQRMLGEALSFEAERKRATALAEIDRAKTAFFSNISHEFRTPLTLMLGPLADLVRDASLSPGAHEQVGRIHRNGLRLLKLVNALLDFSRIEAGRMAARFEPVDLRAFTTELAGVFRAAIERAGLVLEVDCQAPAHVVYVDRGMWEKIVLNLLSNAFNFTFAGTISVRLRPAADHVELVVADTGVGIAAQDVPRVFERFQRIEGTRARTHEGTGIGLALVRDLIELHGGSIAIESEPDRGTTLRVRIPYGKEHLPAEQVHEAASDGTPLLHAEAYAEEAELWLRPARETATLSAASGPASLVYVVDDNADMRDYLTGLLAPRYAVRQFANGSEALAALRAQRPAALVSDVMMPRMDGYALLGALRADPALHDLPVLLLSARAGEEARLYGIQAGADDYLEKPFSSRELLVKVDNLVLRAQMRHMESLQFRHMDTVFRQAPVAIAILRGPEHVYELANPFYQKLIGRPNIVGRPVRNVLPELERQGIIDLLDEVYRTGEPYVGRGRRVDLMRGEPPALQECYFDFVLQPMISADGRIEGIAVVAFEVTDTIKAKQAAEIASRAKDEFMAMLGHELRNPLAPIMTALQLMKLRNVREAEHERAIIERQAQHLVGLVDDLLDVNRVARGKVKLKKVALELATIVADAVETVSPLLEERQHHLRVEVPAHGLPLYGDRHRLCQIVANLLTNAAKYSDNGSLIAVRGRRDGGDIVLEVHDGGHGIEPDMLPHIFEMFYQDQQTLARSRGGLGLGLTIVRSLTELHGGSVSAYSAGRGTGSTFTVRLPALERMVQDGMLAAGPAANDERTTEKRPLSILIVDDNVDAARTLRDLLQSLGHRVEVAYDAPSALLQLDTEMPELAFLDIGLPGMDGYELARRARSMPGGADVQLVALTGYGQESDRERTVEAGFDEHVVKPLSMTRLQQILEKFRA
jgi:signal transduction histidine kinase/DNA-binding response OmpR family regulator